MGQLADITGLHDGETIPVAHTFNVAEVKPGYWKFEDRVSGIADAFPILEIWIQKPTKTNPLHRARFKLTAPVMEVTVASTYNGITPAPTRAFLNTVDVLATFHKRSTEQQRKNVRVQMLNLLTTAGHGVALLDRLDSLW